MKKLSILGILVLVVMAPNLLAGPQASVGSSYGLYQAGQGGEFSLTANAELNSLLGNYSSSTKNGNTFQTFCLEHNEYIYSNTTYDVAITHGAINGGVSGGNPDVISKGTAWLYSLFATGNLAGYNYTGDLRKDSAALLQNAIWCLEGEIGPLGKGTNLFYDAAVDLFGADVASNAAEGEFGVMVLNLHSSTYGDCQDQLVYVPDGGLTVMLLGLGVGGLALFSRKFKQ
jgi:hypothetical protein